MRVETSYSQCLRTEMISLKEVGDLPKPLCDQVQELLKLQLPSVILVSEPADQESSEDRGINFEIIWEAREELKDLYQRFDRLFLDLQEFSKEMCPKVVTQLMEQLESLRAKVQVNLDQLTRYFIEEGYLDSEVPLSELTKRVEKLAPKMREIAKERLSYYEELYWLLARTLCDSQTKRPIQEARVLDNGTLCECSSLSSEALKTAIDCPAIAQLARLITTFLRKTDIYSRETLEEEVSEDWRSECQGMIGQALDFLNYDKKLKQPFHPVITREGEIHSKNVLETLDPNLQLIESKSLIELSKGLIELQEQILLE